MTVAVKIWIARKLIRSALRMCRLARWVAGPERYLGFVRSEVPMTLVIEFEPEQWPKTITWN